MSTDLAHSAQQTLQGYQGRWSCEVDNFYLKTQLGLTDFRVRSYEAVDKYMVAVLLTWAYVELQKTGDIQHVLQHFLRLDPSPA